MSMTPRLGRQDLESMRDRLDRLLGEVGGRTWELLERSMPVDVHENDSHVTVTVSVPGASADQLDIQFSDGLLTVRATTEESSETEEGTWHIRERKSGLSERTIPIPRSADVEKAEASLQDGVLTITFPVAEQSARRRIQIRSNSQDHS
jgi:HSP20 family protein